jgi:2-polyprenyl-3-methyl-5-hydroxy-6-metoxy-1,4-benzoquinol methylase
MNWFESWFDSPYYHLLYADRSQEEADAFIKNIYRFLQIQSTDTILDLACGAGRHSLALAQKGNKILGIDLSQNSINQAKEESQKLHITTVDFQTADMRNFALNITFDYVLNLFTSFGYFQSKSDNQKVADQICQHQNKNGITVIDYLNSAKVKANGESRTVKTVEGIQFNLHKFIEQDWVYKNIQFHVDGQDYQFREQVQLFEKGEIENYFHNAGYITQNHFGNYNLDPYTKESDRSILVFIKQ